MADAEGAAPPPQRAVPTGLVTASSKSRPRSSADHPERDQQAEREPATHAASAHGDRKATTISATLSGTARSVNTGTTSTGSSRSRRWCRHATFWRQRRRGEVEQADGEGRGGRQGGQVDAREAM
jgi:hypothetical protein